MSLTLVRWSGPAAILGGALWGLKTLSDSGDAAPGSGDVTDALFFVVRLLLLVGLAGLYVRYAGRLAGLGQTGFVQAFIGLALLVGGFVAGFSFGVEGAGQILSFGFLILALGLVLLGFATLKTGALPRWNFLPLTMGVLIPLEVILASVASLGDVLSILFGIGWVLLGYLHWTDKDETTRRRATV